MIGHWIYCADTALAEVSDALEKALGVLSQTLVLDRCVLED